METNIKESTTLKRLPQLNCAVCGFKTCDEFAVAVDHSETSLDRCIHLKRNGSSAVSQFNCIDCKDAGQMGKKMGWKDHLKRDFDFILDCFENDPGPRETILPYNPQLIKELGVKKGDVMIGRPMGMSCGCPITHCGVVTDSDPRNGIINWCVTGPLRPRSSGFVDIGYYVAQGYEGLIRESKEKIELGRRYWFLPRRCMLQWRHSGLVNAVTRMKDGSYKVRIEGLFIG
ncbi:MAG: hypothetical protein M0Q38_12720 [Bacteroidales bacterium]|nr:hypothetical protein [Bacteroidales bacterium]